MSLLFERLSTCQHRGQLLPQPPPPEDNKSYTSIGDVTPDYNRFPSNGFGPPPPPDHAPRAMVSVFTSHVDPTDSNAELVPLYRMSWKCSSSSCSHVSHAYTTSSTDVSTLNSWGYTLDGIEGYIYPSTKTQQPPGTVKLCRKTSADDDYILFSGTGTDGRTCEIGDGFTLDENGNPRTDYTGTMLGTDWIGWVYPVRPPQAICANGVPCATTPVNIAPLAIILELLLLDETELNGQATVNDIRVK
jgi:hypothetical protein